MSKYEIQKDPVFVPRGQRGKLPCKECGKVGWHKMDCSRPPVLVQEKGWQSDGQIGATGSKI
jgi:hypothetical protein